MVINSFLTVLEGKKSKNKAPADSASGEGLLPGSSTTMFYVLTWKQGGAGTLGSAL